MRYKFDRSPLIKELELHNNPVTIRVNKFTEDSAAEFQRKMAMAHKKNRFRCDKIYDIVVSSS